jgi:peroxiredoxin Q/BCP
VLKKGGQVVAISVDDVATQRRFKEENRLPYLVLSDAGGKVARQYGGTIPVIGVANRATFVVDQDGTVKEIVKGGDAIDPAGAITSCPVRRSAG